MRPSRTAFVAVFALGAAASCRLLFGVDDLSGDAIEIPRDGAAPKQDAIADAGVPYDCDAHYRLCACEKHDFCDDFDTDETAGKGWLGTGVGNPFASGPINGGDTSNVVVSDAGVNSAGSLLTSVYEVHTPGYAFLDEAIEKAVGPDRAVGGLLYGFDLQLRTLDLVEDRGPIPGGSAVLAAIGHVDVDQEQLMIKIAGVALLAAGDGMYLFASHDLLAAKRDASVTPDDALLKFPGGKLQNVGGWVHFELFLGSLELALARGYTDACTDVPPGLVVAGSLADGVARLCHAAVGDFTDLRTAFGIVAGAALYGGGTVGVRHDSVTLDVLPPGP